MTLRIERVPDGPTTTIRLIGRIRAEYLEELKAEIDRARPRVVLDLEEVGLVDVEGVRFLNACEAEASRCCTVRLISGNGCSGSEVGHKHAPMNGTRERFGWRMKM